MVHLAKLPLLQNEFLRIVGKKEKATMKTYTIKPGDLVEATTALGGSTLLRVEGFENSLLLVRVCSPADPCVSFLISPYNITKVLPHG